MKCHSNAWVYYKDENGKEKGREYCREEATKQCKHGFATCKKHFHGCKDEQELELK